MGLPLLKLPEIPDCHTLQSKFLQVGSLTRMGLVFEILKEMYFSILNGKAW
jgi:hypothetical protein